MKKITLAILMLFSFSSIASAELGINIGVSGNLGGFQASGTETSTETALNTTTHKANETAAVGYSSIFIEKTLPGPLSRFAIGYDYVPSALSSDTVENRIHSKGSTASTDTLTSLENSVKIDFDNLSTYYLTAAVTDNLYLKAGIIEVDILTKEVMASNAVYGDTSMDGTMMAIGYNKTFDNTMFVRVEGAYMDFGSASVTDSTAGSGQKVSMNDLQGATGKISIGKSF